MKEFVNFNRLICSFRKILDVEEEHKVPAATIVTANITINMVSICYRALNYLIVGTPVDVPFAIDSSVTNNALL